MWRDGEWRWRPVAQRRMEWSSVLVNAPSFDNHWGLDVFNRIDLT